uniref:J domain-containing protein n=1 Tax=Glossina brevipalpis TaxID=37001 RepID=A0A1A9W3E2_9MUSC
MEKLLKPSILLQNILNCRKTSYAFLMHQFKAKKPMYYPDRQQETKRMQEQLQNQLVAERNEKKNIPRDQCYKILCVPKDATTSQIKAAYYALAKRYHPDASKGRQQLSLSKRFQEILNAYRCLVNQAKRQENDISESDNYKIPKKEQQKTQPQIVKSASHLLHPKEKQSIPRPILTTMKGNFPSAKNKEDLLKMAKIDPNLELTFLEAVHGLKKVIDLKFLKKCPSCNGKSQRGAGHTNSEQSNGKRYVNRIQCVTCDTCDTCGYVLDATKITVQIPAGIKSGDIVSVENPRTKQRLNYRIQVKESDYYARIGNNVLTDMYITISEAILGGTFKVRGIYETLELKVEPGTESHTQFKLAGKGIKARDGKGDHLVTVKVQIPRQLSVKQRQLILALAKTEEPTYQRSA